MDGKEAIHIALVTLQKKKLLVFAGPLLILESLDLQRSNLAVWVLILTMEHSQVISALGQMNGIVGEGSP